MFFRFPETTNENKTLYLKISYIAFGEEFKAFIYILISNTHYKVPYFVCNSGKYLTRRKHVLMLLFWAEDLLNLRQPHPHPHPRPRRV